MKSLANKSKFLRTDTLVSFAWSLSRSLIGLVVLVGLFYGGALLLDTAFDFLFQMP